MEAKTETTSMQKQGTKRKPEPVQEEAGDAESRVKRVQAQSEENKQKDEKVAKKVVDKLLEGWSGDDDTNTESATYKSDAIQKAHDHMILNILHELHMCCDEGE